MMKTCKECLYFEVCVFRYETLCKGTKVEDLIHDCTRFKDRSKYKEVVRCKDCKKWNEETGFCDEHSQFYEHGMYWDIFAEEDFCSYGERRTENE